MMKKDIIMFDLGGILYSIKHSYTHQALRALQKKDAEPIVFSLEQADPIFGLYDSGHIDTNEFCNHLRNQHHIIATDHDIHQAWNAMLIGIYDYAEELVLEAKKYAQIALLSNINHIHYSAIQEECSSLFSLFDFTFFSYRLKMRKPHVDIFKYALETVKAKPESILFIDDTPANIKAAQSLDIDARLIIPDTKWHIDIMQEFTRY